MRWVAYLLFVAVLFRVAWEYPFLFELPLAGALVGAYWLLARGRQAGEEDSASGIVHHKGE